MMNAALPNIHLVTPNYNGADYLEETLLSVLDQNYPNIHYAIVDGGSTDGSIDILARYRDQLSEIVIEPDGGHADALNKGFSTPRGDIMGWINSDDILLPGCLSIVGRVFANYPEVSWVTGLPTTCSPSGKLTYVGPLKNWSRLRFLAGDHLWIQQESTFWRRSLWDEAGGQLDTSFKVANDFELWSRFFRHADLHTVESMLGCFRVREGQRSDVDRARYMREVDTVLKRELDQLAPDFRETFGSLVPRSPRHLEAEALAELKTELSQADPPVITRRGLRWRAPLDSHSAREVRDPLNRLVSPTSAGWNGLVRRNWRFLASGAGVLSVAGIVAFLAPSLLIWVALICGLGTAFSLIIAIALKTRRIIRTLLSAVAEIHVYNADSTYAQHIIDQELDELSARLTE